MITEIRRERKELVTGEIEDDEEGKERSNVQT